MIEDPAPVSNPRQRTAGPRLSYVILGITLFFYLLQELTRAGMLVEPFLALNRLIQGEALYRELISVGFGDDPMLMLGAKINELIRLGQYWRFFTPALLHGSLMHIGFNMYALFAIGPTVETYFGRTRFLALYLLGAFGGSVLSFLMSPAISIGASGAIFGMIGAEAVFVYQNRALLGPQARAMLTNSVLVIVFNFFLGLTTPGIDNWGHLGGLLAGALFAWFGGPLMNWQMGGYTTRLADSRPPVQVWISGIVVAAIFTGLAVLNF